jgi:cell division protein FtsB
MKKIVKITGITLVALLVLFIILPFAFKGKILDVVKVENIRQQAKDAGDKLVAEAEKQIEALKSKASK